jgi:hypothetical protein
MTPGAASEKQPEQPELLEPVSFQRPAQEPAGASTSPAGFLGGSGSPRLGFPHKHRGHDD